MAAPSTITLSFGMGCFWGAQQRLRCVPGVLATEVGYAGGDDPAPTYERVLAFEQLLANGRAHGRNHAEVVQVTFDVPALPQVLAAFWEGHDPRQRHRQGNDIGSNYRSAIFYPEGEAGPELISALIASRARYAWALWLAAGGQPDFPAPCTEIAPVRHYTPAEAYHQDYLVKNPFGYCGHGGCGVAYDPALPLPSAEATAFWRWLGQAVLTPEAQHIAFALGTERPFSSCLLDEKRHGAFLDPLSGARLFGSTHKFDSGTGWPSFAAAEAGAVTEHLDLSYGMRRIEIRSASSGIHLGHVFDDGPPPTGRRYCLNGAVLVFVPMPQAE